MIEGAVMTEKKTLSMQALGGLARAAKLSGEERSDIARRAADAKWQKEKNRPAWHAVVKMMLAAIEHTGKPHTLYIVDSHAKFCEAGSSFERIWSLDGDTVVGTYATGAQFTDVLMDMLAL